MKHYAFLFSSILSLTFFTACGDNDNSVTPHDSEDSSSSISDDISSSSKKQGNDGSENSMTSSSAKSSSSSANDLSKYDFVWDTFAEAFTTTCDASREGKIGLARYAEDSELICTHDEFLDKWGWLSPSSSSVASSSSAPSSSSSIVRKLESCKTEDEDNCVYDTLTDERDGKTYKTVKIGEQEWMAENLNYKTENSYCYKDDEKKCDSYGRFYTWESAKTICPDGWHLPTVAEFETLITAVDGGSTASNRASLSLLQRASDNYGFTAIEAGCRNPSGDYVRIGSDADFWSATENDSEEAFTFFLNKINGSAHQYTTQKDFAQSVRCLKGASTKQSPATETTYSGSYGTLTDERDGQTYKTVEIGSQTWMAENLKYETEESVCYGNSPENCEKYGSLYPWSDAKDGACPAGWHLPSYGEFEQLIKTIGEKNTAGRKLKSTVGWNNNGNGTDAYGFAALPAAFDGFSLDSLINLGYSANFWSSTRDDKYAYRMYILFSDDDVGLNLTYSDDNLSIRCVKD